MNQEDLMKMRWNPRAFLSTALILTLVTGVAHATEVESRRVNNDMVVLESIPEVPEEIVHQLNRYQNTRGAGIEDWDQDGQSIYITTRFGNTSQLHHVARPEGARRQITFLEEPLSGAVRRPGSSTLGFGMDEGGGEFYQFFILDPVTGSYYRITDGESRNGSPVWRRDGELLAYQSTRRNGQSNDVWIMDPDEPDSAHLVVESPDGSWWGPTSWSSDGKLLLIANYVSITDSRTHLLDLESGELERLAGGGESGGVYLGVDFDRDSKGIFLLTNEDSEFSRLAWMDLTTKKKEIITGDIDWDVGGWTLSEDGTRAAFTANEGGIDRLYLMDPQTRRFKRTDFVPTGLIRGLRFSPDGRRLALTLNSSTSPSDVYTLELGEDSLTATALTRWTYSEVGGLDTEAFVEPELIEFPSFDGRQIPAFVYKPTGPGPHPVVVYIHGGPESQYRPGFRSTFQMWIAELGVAVVAPNVRGSSGYGKEYVKLDNGFKREDSVKDIGALLDWIATQPDLDQGRVAVYGGSYGGYMVLASLMHYGDRLTAGVDIVGVSNFATFLENTEDYRRDLRRVEYGDERDPEMRAFLEKTAPSNNADRISAPLFVAQGQNDPRVPVTESEQIVNAVRAAGFDVWYMNALNEGHGFRKKENRDLYQQIVVMFLGEQLVGEQAPETN
jgi:dipeptidyl aminopeptidase/acylaminoacyl peptidase